MGLQISYLNSKFLISFFRFVCFPIAILDHRIYRNQKHYISDAISEHLGQAKIKFFLGSAPGLR